MIPFRILTPLLALAAAVIARPLAAQEPAAWHAQYPLAPGHPVVAEGWAPMAEALRPEVDLQLRLIGPRLGTDEALDALSLGTHQMGLIALASYPDEFPYWAMLSELFLVGGESLAAAAAITELVMHDCPPCQQNFARRKLVFLGTYGAAPYNLIAPHPLTESNSLEGQIVATPGSLWDRLVLQLGAEAAPTEAEPRQSLVDGRVTALIDIAEAVRQPPLAGHELTVTTLPLGAYRGAGPFMVNRDAWRSLSPGQRERMFAGAAAGIVRITKAYHQQAAANLAAAASDGVTVAPGTLMLKDRIRRFTTADQARVVASAEMRFGIDDAKPFLERLKELYDKYAVLLGPEASEADAIALLTSEIFDRLDAQTYGLR